MPLLDSYVAFQLRKTFEPNEMKCNCLLSEIGYMQSLSCSSDSPKRELKLMKQQKNKGVGRKVNFSPV